ncbi:MAG: hypothetical protein HY365_01535 [Candidatus Aenigmarchaeota archaeon]|nr:hypothetical protein [Candidatus Aenigmarchaeota archaeon]
MRKAGIWIAGSLLAGATLLSGGCEKDSANPSVYPTPNKIENVVSILRKGFNTYYNNYMQGKDEISYIDDVLRNAEEAAGINSKRQDSEKLLQQYLRSNGYDVVDSRYNNSNGKPSTRVKLIKISGEKTTSLDNNTVDVIYFRRIDAGFPMVNGEAGFSVEGDKNTIYVVDGNFRDVATGLWDMYKSGKAGTLMGSNAVTSSGGITAGNLSTYMLLHAFNDTFQRSNSEDVFLRNAENLENDATEEHEKRHVKDSIENRGMPDATQEYLAGLAAIRAAEDNGYPPQIPFSAAVDWATNFGYPYNIAGANILNCTTNTAIDRKYIDLTALTPNNATVEATRLVSKLDDETTGKLAQTCMDAVLNAIK